MRRYDIIDGHAVEHPCGKWVYYSTDVEPLQQKNERLRQRCWALALLLYPSGEPREAVPGDFGIGFDEHPSADSAASPDAK